LSLSHVQRRSVLCIVARFNNRAAVPLIAFGRGHSLPCCPLSNAFEAFKRRRARTSERDTTRKRKRDRQTDGRIRSRVLCHLPQGGITISFGCSLRHQGLFTASQSDQIYSCNSSQVHVLRSKHAKDTQCSQLQFHCPPFRKF